MIVVMGVRAIRTVLQLEATECGAACLAMVLAHYGRHVPLERMREECGVSRDGARASNLVRAARSYGLDARGWRLEPQDLWAHPMPAIVHWNFDHFVVLEGRRRHGDIQLNDPARGRRRVSEEEFDRSFTGVALTFTPTAEFARGGSPYSVVAALRRQLAPARLALLQAMAAGVLLLVPGVVLAVLAQTLVDTVLVAGDTAVLPALVLAAVICALGTWLLLTVQRRALVRAQLKVGTIAEARFVAHLLRVPTRFFSTRLPGDLANRVLGNQKLAALVLGQLAAAAINAVTVVMYALLMAWHDLQLTVVAVMAVSLNLLVLGRLSRRRAPVTDQVALIQGQVRGELVEGLQSIETLKASGGETDLFTRWAGGAARMSAGTESLARSSAAIQVLPVVSSAVVTALVLCLGGLAVVRGDLSLGELVAFQVLLAAFLVPMQQLSQLSRVLQQAGALLRRIDDVFANPADAPTAPAAGRSLRGRVELQDVVFGYSPLDEPLLAGLTLTIEPGTRVALVGASGSGKSTVARLVAGLEQPWSGHVVLDGELAPAQAPSGSIGYVDQEIVLFEGTVAENLTLWDSTVPEPVMVQAARDACVHDEIASRPGAYASRVADAGRNFSGGQRQRLEIARALVPGPAVLLLDEATSALDPFVEHEIDAHLRRRGCTSVIVAHRLSTVRDADEIIVLERGRVVERGTHEQLMAAGGAYRELVVGEEEVAL